MTLLIRNVQILGSDQKLPDRLDVFVSGEKIAAIGRFPGKKADEIIEGAGCYLSPGFIDIDTESDHYLSLFSHPSQDDFLKQGVTTIVGGLCGASLAPLIYGNLESIEDWTDTRQVNVDWHSVSEFLKVLERRRLGVNFATLVGHTTIRQAIIGGAPRDLTKNELKIFAKMLEQALRDGAFGFSTALSYVQNRATPYSEIKFLASVVKEADAVYATHLRNDTYDLIQSVEEAVKIANETGAKTFISHLLPLQNFEKEYEQALNRFEQLPETLDFHFSLYPSKIRILKLYTFLPSWAQKDDLKVMSMSLQDSWLRGKILKDMPKIDPKEFIVAQAPGNNSLVGYSLVDLKKLYSLKTYEETLLKLMETTNFQGSIFYSNTNEYLIRRAIQSKRSFVASNAASLPVDAKIKTLKPERATSTFTKFLSWVQDDKIMTIEDAVKKITFEPARKLGLKNRGVVKAGYFADLTGFKGSEVLFTVVNGQVAVKNGEFSNVFNGQVLRH
ncbi:MAG: hypothetical protein AAB738_00245 [Patescibacteria group bacterium]